MTVHTQFDLVAPYPKFEPRISLKRDNCVVVNTGNFLHSITVDMEQLTGDQEEQEDGQHGLHHKLHCHSMSPPMQPISVNVGSAEFSIGTLRSPTGFSPASIHPTSDSENTDGESDVVNKQSENQRTPTKTHRTRSSPRVNRSFEERREKVSEFAQMLSGSPSPKKPKYSPFKKLCIQGLENSDSFEFAIPSTSKEDTKKSMADAAYAMTDESFDVTKPEKLSTFRKKRLAEKKYEFTEGDEFGGHSETETNNFKPLTRLRSRKIAEKKRAEQETLETDLKNLDDADDDLREVMKMEDAGEVMVCVSKGDDPEGAQNDYWSDVMASTTYPELLSPGGCIKKDGGHASSSCLSPRISAPMSPAQISSAVSPRAGNIDTILSTAKFSRCYVEVDDELISVITDVEVINN